MSSLPDRATHYMHTHTHIFALWPGCLLICCGSLACCPLGYPSFLSLYLSSSLPPCLHVLLQQLPWPSFNTCTHLCLALVCALCLPLAQPLTLPHVCYPLSPRHPSSLVLLPCKTPPLFLLLRIALYLFIYHHMPPFGHLPLHPFLPHTRLPPCPLASNMKKIRDIGV